MEQLQNLRVHLAQTLINIQIGHMYVCTYVRVCISAENVADRFRSLINAMFAGGHRG